MTENNHPRACHDVPCSHPDAVADILSIHVAFESTQYSTPSILVRGIMKRVGGVSTITRSCVKRLLKKQSTTRVPDIRVVRLEWYIHGSGNIQQSRFKVVSKASYDVELCIDDCMVAEEHLKALAKQGVYSFFSPQPNVDPAEAARRAAALEERRRREEEEMKREMQVRDEKIKAQERRRREAAKEEAAPHRQTPTDEATQSEPTNNSAA